MIHEEAKVSILLSNLMSDEEVVAALKNLKENNDELYLYNIILKWEDDNIGPEEVSTMEEITNNLKKNFLKTSDISKLMLKENYFILVFDRDLPNDKAYEYYFDIISYHQAEGENLSEEELEMRDKEVKEKWFNGNFNYWLLRNEDEI